MQPVGGFLKGVGAMGDDHTAEAGILTEGCIDPPQQLQPEPMAHISAVDVGELFHLQIGHAAGIRQRCEQLLTIEHPGVVILQGKARLSGAGDGATRAKHQQTGEGLGGPLAHQQSAFRDGGLERSRRHTPPKSAASARWYRC